MIDFLIGDSRLWSLEHRLFNSFALLNGISNTLGSLNPSSNYAWLFVLNHTDEQVQVPARGTDLVTGAAVDGAVRVAPGGVAVVREGAQS